MPPKLTLVIAVALATAACSKKEDSASSKTSETAAKATDTASNEKAAATKPTETVTGSATSSSNAGRPAVITDEMNATFDAYVTAFEKLTKELAAVAPDCKKAVAVVERNARELDALDARGAALTEQMSRAKGDPAAGEWFGKTYAPRMKAAVDKMKPLVASCENDAALKAAMTGVMARFPMMRRK